MENEHREKQVVRNRLQGAHKEVREKRMTPGGYGVNFKLSTSSPNKYQFISIHFKLFQNVFYEKCSQNLELSSNSSKINFDIIPRWNL